MDLKEIVIQAGHRAGRPNVRKVALIYGAVAALVSLALLVVNLLLDRGIADTGGLGGMQLRATLSSAQMLLTLATTVLLPFWDLGFHKVALNLGRGEAVCKEQLLDGFRRFGSALGMMLLKTLFFSILTALCFYGATIAFVLSPLSDPLFVALKPIMDSLDPYNPSLPAVEALAEHMIPLYIMVLLAVAIVVIPAVYRLRMAEFNLLDGYGPKAALRNSARFMRGKRLQLFRMELRFWWYFLLQALAAVVGYGDMLFGLEGIGFYIGFYGVSLLGQFVLSVFAAPRLLTAYALFYEWKEEKGQVV